MTDHAQNTAKPAVAVHRGHYLGRAPIAYWVILAAVAILPYLNSLFNGFVYDDSRQILANPYLRSWRFLPKVFSTTVWSFVGAQGVTNYYRPMMTLGYLVCYQIFGPMAYGFHLVSLLLNVGVTLLVFQVGRRLLGQDAPALIAAVLFALHPIHTEAVDWIAAVTDLEVTFFYLVTFAFFLRLPSGQGGRSSKAELAMVASFALTILSKEQSLTFPLLATVYEHFYREDRSQTSLTQKVARYGLLWLMDLAYVLFRVRFLGAFAPRLQMSSLTTYQIFLSAIALVGQYLGKLFWPVRLCAYYMFHKSVSWHDPHVLLGILGLLISAAVFVWLWRHQRAASFGLIWMFLTLSPVLDARFLAGNVFAERYLYLPSVGFAWSAGWGAVRLWRSLQARPRLRWGLALAAAALAVLSVIRIIRRNHVWRNNHTLYTETLKLSPDATHIRNDLGVTCWNEGNYACSGEQWRLILDLTPHDPIALSNLGLYDAQKKQYQKAAHYFRLAMRIAPIYTDPHTNLGNVYEKQGKLASAQRQFEAAAILSPLFPATHNDLAKIYAEEGKIAQAEEQYRVSRLVEPNYPADDGLAGLLLRQGDVAGAERNYRRAIKLYPLDYHAHFGLARIALAAGHHAAALREYQRGLLTDPRNAAALAAVQKLRIQLQHANLNPR
jgi:tetratricopeptide (TPR) repeat protein